MYADDPTIYCIGESVDSVTNTLNNALKELEDWSSKNNLVPHPKKREAMKQCLTIMITIFYIIETILIYFYSLGFSLNARPHKRQHFNHHRVEIKVVVVVVVWVSKNHMFTNSVAQALKRVFWFSQTSGTPSNN